MVTSMIHMQFHRGLRLNHLRYYLGCHHVTRNSFAPLHGWQSLNSSCPRQMIQVAEALVVQAAVSAEPVVVQGVQA